MQRSPQRVLRSGSENGGGIGYLAFFLIRPVVVLPVHSSLETAQYIFLHSPQFGELSLMLLIEQEINLTAKLPSPFVDANFPPQGSVLLNHRNRYAFVEAPVQKALLILVMLVVDICLYEIQQIHGDLSIVLPEGCETYAPRVQCSLHSPEILVFGHLEIPGNPVQGPRLIRLCLHCGLRLTKLETEKYEPDDDTNVGQYRHRLPEIEILQDYPPPRSTWCQQLSLPPKEDHQMGGYPNISTSSVRLITS